MLTGRKLALTLAFTVLVALAFGVSCRGFFPKPVLQSVALQPPTPQIQFNETLNMQAYGTYDDGTRSLITSGVAWSSDNANVSIDTTTGVALGVSLGTATLTAAAQGLSGTASAIVYLGTITSLTVTPQKWTVSSANPVAATFVATATSNGAPQDVTTGATWTPSPAPALGAITCTNSGAPPETCTIDPSTTQGSYKITVTYPGTTLAPVVTVTIGP